MSCVALGWRICSACYSREPSLIWHLFREWRLVRLWGFARKHRVIHVTQIESSKYIIILYNLEQGASPPRPTLPHTSPGERRS